MQSNNLPNEESPERSFKDLSGLSSFLNSHLDYLVTGDNGFRESALSAAKYLFDIGLKHERSSQISISDLIDSLTSMQLPLAPTQSQPFHFSRSSDETCASIRAMLQVTQLLNLHTDGMTDDQIWAQFDLKVKPLCTTLDCLFPDQDMPNEDMNLWDNTESIDTNEEDYRYSDMNKMETQDLSTDYGEDEFSDIENVKNDISVAPMATKSRIAKRCDALDLLKFSTTKLDENEELEDPVDVFAIVDKDIMYDEENPTYSGAFYNDFFDSNEHMSTVFNGKTNNGSKVRFNEAVNFESLENFDQEDNTSGIEVDNGEESEGSSSYIQLPESSNGDTSYEVQSDASKTIGRLKDDLFAEESLPRSDSSSYERRQVALLEHIASLEADNVAQKDWTLMGEATARSRAKNALLEEDLEFEHVMRTMPTSTQMSVEGLEDRIKARILNREYDDVIRRKIDMDKDITLRPTDLEENKSKHSLAQIYESEFINHKGDTVEGDQDNAQLRAHQQIDMMWEKICYRLDALSNVHFTPKLSRATVSLISNVSALNLESSLPSIAAVSNARAPEEMFSAISEDFRAKLELNSAEKRALRRKEKITRRNQKRKVKL